MARALRRKASSVAALALLACGGFAGAAFGDGLPIGSLTTSIIPTIGATTAISTPTVSIPSVTVPPVTVPPVTTPAVTTPPVSAPTVAVPPVSVSATVPVTPTSTPIAATVSTPVASVSVSASARPPAPVATVHLDASMPKPADSATVASHGASVSVSATPVAVSVSAAPTAVRGAPLEAIAPRLRSPSVLPLRPASASTLPRLVPLPSVTQPTSVVRAVPELQPVTTRPTPSGSVWSTVAKNPGAAAGGIAALLTLAGLGVAAAARSSAFAAACAELARFPFPRFRVLPCPDLPAATGASGVAAGSSAAGPAAANGATPPSRHVPGGSAPPFPPLPRIGGVLGASVTKAPWTIFKAIVVAVLAVVNALVFGIRWRVGRLQSR